MKVYSLATAIILNTFFGYAQPVLTAGAATNVVAVGLEAQWQGFRNIGSGTGLYAGTNINSSSRHSSTIGNNTFNKPGNNNILLSFNSTTDVLTATVNNNTTSFSDVTSKMYGTSVCRLNYMQISMGDNKNNDIVLNNITIAGRSLGNVSYTGGLDKYWNITNIDFTSSFTLTATIVLDNSSYGSGGSSFVNITVGERMAGYSLELGPCCEGSPAELMLKGLLPNKTYSAKYSIGLLGSTLTSPSFTTDASGNAIMLTRNVSTADLSQLVIIKSLNGGCDINVPLLSSIGVITLRNYWVGGLSSDWANPLNWAGGIVPNGTCSKIVIPNGTLFDPSLNGVISQVKNLEIKPGVTVEIKNATLKVSGDIINQGVLDVSNGTLDLNGTTAVQSLTGSAFKNKTIKNLVNNNKYGINVSSASKDTLKIAGNITFGDVNNSVINTGDNLTLLSAAGGTAVVNDMTNDGMNSGNQILGKVHVERYVSNAAKWRLVSINSNTTQTFKQAWQEGAAAASGNPTPGYGMIIGDNRPASYVANGFDAYTPGGPTVKTYNSATNTWVGISNTSQLINSTSGYMAYIRSNRSGNLSSTILRTSGALKSGTQPQVNIPRNTFVAVGNPYAAPINVTKINAIGLQEVYYIWDPKLGGSYGLGAYQSLIKVGANYVIFPGGGSYGPQMTPTNMIESGQAFFVKAGSTGGSLQFEERSKGLGSNMVFRGEIENSPTIRASLLVPSADTALMLDATMINFDTDYSDNIDDDDIDKVGNNNENICVQSKNSYLMAERKSMKSTADTIQLYMTGVRVQKYKWQFNLDHMEPTGRIVTLVDRYTNNRTVLNAEETTSYDFHIINVAASYATNRFYMVIENEVVVPVSITHVVANRTVTGAVNVDWTVAGERKTDSYEVETSTNAVDFNRFASAQAKADSSGLAGYSNIHNDATPATNYYRIKVTSAGGRVQYSKTVEVVPDANLKSPSISVFPNPVEDKSMKITFKGKKGSYELKLVGITGNSIYTKSITVTDNNSSFSLPLGSQTAPGRYTIIVTGSDGTNSVQPLIIL